MAQRQAASVAIATSTNAPARPRKGRMLDEFEVSLPVFAEHSLNGGVDGGYGWLTAGFGAGAVLSGVVLIRWPQTGLRRMLLITIGYGMSVAATAAFIGSTPIGASIVGAVADAFGGRAALAVGAIACFTVVAAGVIVMVRAHPKAVAGQPERRR